MKRIVCSYCNKLNEQLINWKAVMRSGLHMMSGGQFGCGQKVTLNFSYFIKENNFDNKVLQWQFPPCISPSVSVWRRARPRWRCGVCWCPVGPRRSGPGTRRATRGVRWRRRRWPSWRPGADAAEASAAGSLGSRRLCVSSELLAAAQQRWCSTSAAAAPETLTPPAQTEREISVGDCSQILT